MALRFDRFAKRVSRRGLAAVLGGGPLAGSVPESAQGGSSCGGQSTRGTRICGGGGACDSDEDCAAGCACVERTVSCSRKRRRKHGRRPRSRIFVRGRPGLYCTRAP